MTTFVLVHGAWHGPWAWDAVVGLLETAGAHTITPDLSGTVDGEAPRDVGLHDHAHAVADAIDTVPPGEKVILVGHSYAGLVVREAADARPAAVDRIVLVDGWAGPNGASMFSLAPGSFESAIRTASAKSVDGRFIPAPPPSAFGISDTEIAGWLAPRLIAQPLQTFIDATNLTEAVDDIPGLTICCQPATYPFERLAQAVGYRTVMLDAPHDAMLTQPGPLARILLDEAVQDQEVRKIKKCEA